MKIMDILNDLSKQGLELWLDHGQVRYRGPRQVLTQAVLTRLKQNKHEIIEALQGDDFISRVYPLSHPQRAMWYLYQSAPDSPAYNTALPVRLLFEVDKPVLEFALQSLLSRHPCLRTTFAMEAGKPVQRIHAYREVCFETIDASTWTGEKLIKQVKQAHERAFALEQGPIMRAALFSRSKNDHVFLISIHHIVCDGWSMWTLTEELWKIYLDKKAVQGSSYSPMNHKIHKYPRQIPSLIDSLAINPGFLQIDRDFGTRYAKGNKEYQSFIYHLLLDGFQRMGVFLNSGETHDKEQLKKQLGIMPQYYRLYEAMLDILQNSQFIRVTGNQITFSPRLGRETINVPTGTTVLQDKKQVLTREYPDLEAYVNLLWICLQALPQVLTGKKNHMEVMFPNGSMELVENTYRGNKIVDYYNRLAAEIVKTYTRERLQQDAQAVVRVLEVGAGTGSTTQFVLAALRDNGSQDHVHYIYTDVSPGFTRFAENLLAREYPFITFKVLDVEKNPDQQGFKPGSMDIILASNVLHATRSVAQSLSHLKRVLKTNGLLIINEVTQLQDSMTLTFGLTDGWWRFEDEENRIKGSPLVSREQWQQLLTASGFKKTKFFNLSQLVQVKGLGWQHMIIAESDGLVMDTQIGQPGTGLSKLNHTYEEYVRWQAKLLAGSEGERQWNYWQNQLSSELPVLNLPIDRPRPQIQTYRGSWHPFRIKRELSLQLNRMARENGVTLYNILLSAYHILLHRFTGQEDILVGCPTTGRTQEAFNGVVGHFVNTLVLRTDFSGNPTVNHFIRDTGQTLLDALDHQEYPFELLVDRLNPRRDASRTPIYQTLFVFQKPHNLSDFIEVLTDFYAGPARVNLGELVFESFPISQQEGQFDMSIEMTGTEESLKGVLKFNQDVFEEATTKRIARYFLNILECMVNQPDRLVSELDFLSRSEKHQLLEEWNNTDTGEEIILVHRLFEQQVTRTPDASTLVFHDRHLSYRQLNRQANQLARYLAQQGTGSDDRVGICIERSFEMVISVIGTLKAGAAYVPLDPQYPGELLSYIIRDSQTAVLLVNDHLVELFQPGTTSIINVDKEWDKIADQQGENLDLRISPRQLTYIIYTSGSTGKPKGIAMVLEADANLVQWQIKISTACLHTRTLQFTTLNFDISFQEMFSTFGTGGTLLLIKESLRHDPVGLLRLLKKESLERIFLPYVYLKMLTDTVAANEQLLPLSLREVFTAGEQLRITPALVNMFRELSNCTLHNHYGPTECYVVTGFTLQRDPGQWPLLPAVGRPIDNVHIYILDHHMKPVPIGVTGEIFISGVCVARGYQNLPEMTEKLFIQAPFNVNERLYRTGDLARYRPDGNIEFLGRSDHQLKIRGFRIEPDEIKNHLLSHEHITDAFVTDHEDQNGIKSLLAYVVSENDLSVAVLKDYLSGKLPHFMVPSYFVKLDKIPRLPSSKVKRSALPGPDGSISSGVDYAAPGDEVEKTLVAIWQEVLNLQRVGINDDLFDIGGNSLTTLSIQKRIDEFYPGKITIPELIQYPTVSMLAQLVRTRECAEVEMSDRDEQLQNFLSAITQDDV